MHSTHKYINIYVYTNMYVALHTTHIIPWSWSLRNLVYSWTFEQQSQRTKSGDFGRIIFVNFLKFRIVNLGNPLNCWSYKSCSQNTQTYQTSPVWLWSCYVCFTSLKSTAHARTFIDGFRISSKTNFNTFTQTQLTRSKRVSLHAYMQMCWGTRCHLEHEIELRQI